MLQHKKLNKRGLSEIVGYVILVIIGISLSVIIFQSLKLQLPKDQPSCPAEISLIVENPSCSLNSQNLSFTITNRGLFSVDAAYLRFGLPEEQVKILLNEEDLFFATKDSPRGLAPQESRQFTFQSSEIIPETQDYELEVQPAVFDDNNLALCDKAIIAQPITCE